MKGLKRIFVIFVAIGLGCLSFYSNDLVQAKDSGYPTKPINLYISFQAGGTLDIITRALIEPMGKLLGKPIVPINKPGAGGALAATAVMNSKPDGYTIGTLSSSGAFAIPFADDAPYKDLSGFTMLGNFSKYLYINAVRGDAPWKTWKEFIEWARKNPGGAKLSGMGGSKTTSIHAFTLYRVEKKEQVEFSYVAGPGGPQGLTLLLGGHVNVFCSTLNPAFIQYLEEGKVRILSYMGTDKDKIPGYENIPSFQELYGFSILNIMGLAGPKGLPDDVTKRIEDAMSKAVEAPAFVKVTKELYSPVHFMNGAQFKKYNDENFVIVSEIMKKIKAEEKEGKK